MHTFAYANAVHQGLRRIDTQELLREVFDGAMRVYLNRFLNVPPVPLPKPKKMQNSLKGHTTILDTQQQVNQAGQLVLDYLYNNGKSDRLLATIGKVLLREDRNFHSIQMLEAAFRQYSLVSSTDSENNDNNSTARTHLLIAAARYLAAHSPTMRSQGHTYKTASRLHLGEHLFEEKQ